VGVYSKSVVLEPCGAGGTAVFMVDRGIHRHALFKIAGKLGRGPLLARVIQAPRSIFHQ
jgi:hypothetical protein